MRHQNGIGAPPARVLVVDDQDPGRYALVRVLRRAGFTVVEATTGPAGLEAARLGVDLVVLDVNLPGLDGFEVCRRLKADPLTARVPVLLSSAHFTGAHDRVRGLDGGADAYLAQPFEPAELLATAGALLRTRREHEEHLRLLGSAVASARDGIVITEAGLDEPGPRIVFANDAQAAMSGYAAHELIGRAPRLFQGPGTDRAALDRLRAALEHGEPVEAELLNYTRDGRPYWVEIGVVPVQDDAGRTTHFVSVQRDVTERRRAEQALRESEERFRTLFERSPDGVVLIDPHDPAVRSRIVDCNESFARMNGYERHELIGRSIDLLHERTHDREETLSHLAWLREATGRTSPGRHRRKDGRFFPIESSASLVRIGERDLVLGIDRDITDRLSAEAALAEANRRATHEYEQLLERLVRLSQAFGTAPDLTSVFRALLAFAVESVPCNGLLVSLYDPQRRSRRCVFSGGPDGEDDLSGLPTLPLNGSPSSRAIESGEVVVTGDFQAALTQAGVRPVVLGLPADPDQPQSSVAVPLRVQGRTLGVFEVQSTRPDAYDDEHVTALLMAAGLAAVAVENVLALERERALSASLERRLRRAVILREIDSAIASGADVRLTLNLFLAHALRELAVDAGAVSLLDAPSGELRVAAHLGLRTADRPWPPVPLGEGLAGRAALERRTVEALDLAVSPVTPAVRRRLKAEGFRAHVVTPLVVRDRVLGVFGVFSRSALAPDDEWRDFLATLAGQAAIALDNAALLESTRRSNAELSLAYDVTIEGWARALDLRDKETEGHSRRVTEMTVRLAREMGVGEDELVHLRRGALLHDLGKLGVPDSILLKPGALSDDEWAVMRRHPDLAREMLEPVEFLRPALTIPYSHHERWDGGGYPRGLAGDTIPLAARIFAVVDVFDALTNDRPYRAAWPVERALEHLAAGAGRHFDPAVVEAFFAMMAHPDRVAAGSPAWAGG